MRQLTKLATAGALGALLAFPLAAQAGDDAADPAAADAPKKVRCISQYHTRINHTKVIDDQTVILFMNGGPDYKLTLAHRCPGLKMQKTIYLDTRINKLCDVDTIEVPLTTVGNVLSEPRTRCMIGSIEEYVEPEKTDDADKS